jgi:hypothetical protein
LPSAHVHNHSRTRLGSLPGQAWLPLGIQASPAMLHECRRVMFGCLRVNIFFHAGQPGPAKLLFGLMHVQTNARKIQPVFKETLPRVRPCVRPSKRQKNKSRGASHAKGWLLHGAITCMSHLARLVEPRTCNQSRP